MGPGPGQAARCRGAGAGPRLSCGRASRARSRACWGRRRDRPAGGACRAARWRGTGRRRPPGDRGRVAGGRLPGAACRGRAVSPRGPSWGLCCPRSRRRDRPAVASGFDHRLPRRTSPAQGPAIRSRAWPFVVFLPVIPAPAQQVGAFGPVSSEGLSDRCITAAAAMLRGPRSRPARLRGPASSGCRAGLALRNNQFIRHDKACPRSVWRTGFPS